jgi:plasmid rolling circle replication initiator protein Rep
MYSNIYEALLNHQKQNKTKQNKTKKTQNCQPPKCPSSGISKSLIATRQ